MTTNLKAKTFAEDLLAGRYSELSRSPVPVDERLFYRWALFAGLDAPDDPRWNALLDASVATVQQGCHLYLLGLESYNAYKHGFRMKMGAFRLDLTDPATPAGWTQALHSHDSLQYLVPKRGAKKPQAAGADRESVYLLETHLFNPEVSGSLIRLLRPLTENLITCRLDALLNRAPRELHVLPPELLGHVREALGEFQTLTLEADPER